MTSVEQPRLSDEELAQHIFAALQDGFEQADPWVEAWVTDGIALALRGARMLEVGERWASQYSTYGVTRAFAARRAS